MDSASDSSNNSSPARKETSRKQAVDRLDFVLNATKLGLFEWHIASGSLRPVNPRFFEIFGLSGRDAAAAPGGLLEFFKHYLHPADAPGFEQALNQSAKTLTALSFVCRIIMPGDQNERWIELNGDFDPAEEGEAPVLLGVVQDVSRHQQALRASRENEKKLQMILEQIPVGVGVMDTKGRFTFKNEAMGYYISPRNVLPSTDPQQIPAWTVSDAAGNVLAPHDWPGAKALRGELTSGSDFLFNRNGEITWAQLSATPVITDGIVTGAIMVVQDVTDYKKSQEKIRESEEQLRLFISSSNDVVYRMSADWNSLYYLDGKDIITDKKKEGVSWIEQYIPVEDRPLMTSVIRKAIETKSLFQLEHRMVRADGSIGWANSRAMPLIDDNGEITGWFGTATDVTARKCAEIALKDSEEKYRLLYEGIDEGFCIIRMIFDENGKPCDYVFEDVNPAFERQTGLSDAVGRSMREIAPKHEQHWFDIYGEIVKSRKSVRFENSAAELHRYYDVYAFPFGQPEQKLVGVLFNDVSAKKVAVDALRVSEERLRLAAETTGFGTYDFHVPSNTFIWSPEVYRLYGIDETVAPSPEIMLARIHPDDRTLFQQAVQASTDPQGKGQLELIYRIVSGNDEVRWVRDFNRSYTEGEGAAKKVVRVVGTLHEITKLKQAEEALIEANNRKDQFLAILAHELRNPLTPVKGALQLLNEPDSDPATEKIARDMIDRQVNKLVRLIDDLMDISRITRNKIKLQRRHMDFAEAAEAAIETTLPLIAAENHTFSKHLPAEPVYIHADPDRMVQVITNLLTNAAKYTPRHGKLALTLSREDGHALLMVKDNGIGIPKDEQERIFEMFQQYNGPGARMASGLGIGLSLARTLVEMHGGSISVTSADNEPGSEFVIRMPLSAVAAEVEKVAEVEDDFVFTTPLRVLVVDDNADITDVLKTSLQKKGLEVAGAYSGRSALEVAKDFLPEAAVVDIGLPDIDGYEVARELREQFPDILLIAHSGWGQPADKEKSIAAGFDTHLVKPAGVKMIVDVLKNF